MNHGDLKDNDFCLSCKSDRGVFPPQGFVPALLMILPEKFILLFLWNVKSTSLDRLSGLSFRWKVITGCLLVLEVHWATLITF